VSNDKPKPSGIDPPEPWNFNDTIVWKAIICKFICETKRRSFELSELLSYDKIPIMAGAYNQDEIRKSIHDDKTMFRELINYCMNWLEVNDLIKIQKNNLTITYNATSRLESLCKEIVKYQLPVIDPVIEAEKAIVSRNIALRDFLSELEKKGDLDLSEASQAINDETLYLINQLGIIYISVNDKISISPVGRMVTILLLLRTQIT
jgi:hypothetical protein